jgi:hypothetical protein
MDQEPRALIKRHNEYVREQVVHDLEALEEKLNVKRQVSAKAHTVVEKAKGTLGMNQDGQVHGVGGFARKNAVPLAAVGLGGALLARNAAQMKSSNDHNGTYIAADGTPYAYGAQPTYESSASSDEGMKDKLTGKAGDAKSAVTGKASDVKSSVAGKASDVKDTVGSKASDVKDTVSDAGTMVAVRASELKDKVPSRYEAKRMAKENAPVLGIAALAIGAIAGALAPRTRMEEQKLAPVQEGVLDKAKETVTDKVDMAKDAVQSGVDTVKDEMGGGSEEPKSTTTPNRITAGSTNGLSTPAGSL